MKIKAVEVKLVFRNHKALRAIQVVAEVLNDLQKDLTWRDDVKRASQAAMYAVKHLSIQTRTR